MMDKKSAIQFQYQERKFGFPNRTACKEFLEKMIRKEKKRLESLNYIFCSDDFLLKINQDHLQHDFYTDIISFGLSAPGEPIIGEIYISIDRVKDNARSLGEPFLQELHRVIFHGALHLCGYRDKSRAEITLMRKMEDSWLSAYFK